jgi:hypothetical protein
LKTLSLKTNFTAPWKPGSIEGVGLDLIMEKLNHNSLAYTKRYLGITDDELEAVVRKLNL